MASTRIPYLDALRIISICAIVLLHAAGSYWPSLDVDTADWSAANIYDCITRWGVPVFVMISGALFLDPSKPQSIRKLWSKNIPHIAAIILFWGLFYALLYKWPSEITVETLLSFVKEVVFGPFHFWFLFMLLGLYMLVPILRCVTSNRKATEYFLVLGFIVNLVLPALTFGGSLPVVKEFFDLFLIQVPLGYTFLFILGYYLSAFELSFRARVIVYALGSIGLVVATMGTAELSIAAGKPDTSLISTSFCFIFAAMSIFLLTKQAFQNLTISEQAKDAISAWASCVLGVYAIHIAVMRLLIRVGFGALTGLSAVVIPVLALVTILISFPIAYGMKRIPWFGTHLV